MTRIIVGLDGSDTSRAALVWASHQAVRRGAVIEPALAWQYPVTSMTALGAVVPMLPRDEMQAAAATDLALMVHEVEDDLAPGVELGEHHVCEGPPGSELTRLAADADLLVVGSRGLGGFRGLVLGSVSAHCAGAAVCPVAIVPAGWEHDEGARDIVVGVDGSDNARAAAEWADGWISEGGVLRLVHIWSAVVPYSPMAVPVDPAILESAAEELVTAAAAGLTHEATAECATGDARQELTARAAGADMLVIGARGHGGLTRLITGSVASSVVHHLACPTVVVPA